MEQFTVFLFESKLACRTPQYNNLKIEFERLSADKIQTQ